MYVAGHNKSIVISCTDWFSPVSEPAMQAYIWNNDAFLFQMSLTSTLVELYP